MWRSPPETPPRLYRHLAKWDVAGDPDAPPPSIAEPLPQELRRTLTSVAALLAAASVAGRDNRKTSTQARSATASPFREREGSPVTDLGWRVLTSTPVVDDDDDASIVRPRSTSSALHRSRSTSRPRLPREMEYQKDRCEGRDVACCGEMFDTRHIARVGH